LRATRPATIRARVAPAARRGRLRIDVIVAGSSTEVEGYETLFIAVR
jgi:hypothetical protein